METNHTQDFERLESFDLKHLFYLLRRWAWLLVVAVVLGSAIAYSINSRQAPIYEANTQVMLTHASSDGPVADITQALNVQQITQTYVELMGQRWMLDDVAQRVGGDVSGGQIKVSAAPNTQIIGITVEDPDPNRAALIADTLVTVLIEQNENIQSGRYADAENSLAIQIEQMETQIAGLQSQVDQAKQDALAEQLVTAKSNVEETQGKIEAAQAEIRRLQNITAFDALMSLNSKQAKLDSLLALTVDQADELEALRQQIAANSLVREDPLYATQVHRRAAELESELTSNQAEIESLQLDMEWLKPLVETGMLEKTLAAQREQVATLNSLLPSYQQIYTNMLVSGRISNTTDEIETLEKNLTLYQQIYLGLLDDRETVRLERMQGMPNVVQLSPAIASGSPVRPRTLTNTLIAGLSSFALAFAVMFLIEYLDDSIRTADQINMRLKLPVIGYIAEHERGMDQAYIAEHPRSPVAEAFRTLRTNLEFAAVDSPLKILLVVSPNPEEGKSNTAVNLAITIAQGGKRVILIDADLRRPRVHRYLGLTNRKGLSDLFRGSLSIDQVISVWKHENLAVITSGSLPPNPADLLASEKMAGIIKTAAEAAEFVIIDAPPFLVADASILAARVDGVLFVIQTGKTPLETALFTLEQLKRAGARTIGVVLNRIPRSHGYYGGGYRNSHAYYENMYLQYYPESGKRPGAFTGATSLKSRKEVKQA